jgi:hypothetical protein
VRFVGLLLKAFMLNDKNFVVVGHAAGGAVVEALRYKPEGRGVDSRWCHWNFSLTILAALWPWRRLSL